MTCKTLRSLLFIPASRTDMIARAHERGADAIILDLEDGVANADKPAARNSLGDSLQRLKNTDVEVMLRINCLHRGGELDIKAIPEAFTPALLLPKVTAPDQVVALQDCWTASGKALVQLQLLPMIECPKGLFRAEKIASASERNVALVFGSEDFATSAGINTDVDALAVPAQWVALAAAAAEISAYGLPGSLANYQDLDLFHATLRSAKKIGFHGSLCIHPKQVALANEVFQPSANDIEWAQAIIDQMGNSGATGGDMGMIDAPIVARAKAILAH